MKKGRFCALSVSSLLAASSMVATSNVYASAAGTGGVVTLTFYSAAAEQTAVQSYKQLVAKFEKRYPNIHVNITFPGAQYESVINTMMAANNLPDLFQTIGWTRDRYAPYLLNLAGSPWTRYIASDMKPFVTEKGKVLALPISQDKAGINVNMAILKKYHLGVPSTWNQLVIEAQTIKTKSKGAITPIDIAGGDGWPIGAYLDWMAIPDLISASRHNAAALKNGTFNFKKWDVVFEQLKQLQDDQLLNADVLTEKYVTSSQRMAQGTVAFAFYGQGVVSEVQRLNPKADFKMMPIPSVVKGDAPAWSGGEGEDSLAIAKGTKNAAAAKIFVNYVAEPKNVKLLIGNSPTQSGLTDVNINTSSAYTTASPSVRVFQAFDREYFPNGMYNVMEKTGEEVLAGSASVPQATQQLEQSYQRLRETGSSS